MITPNGNHLVVIEDMQIDWNLPKYRKPKPADEESSSFSLGIAAVARSVAWDSGGSVNGRVSVVLATPDNKEIKPRTSVFERLAFWRKAAAPLPASAPEPEPTLSIAEFFKSVKNTQQELVIVEERAVGYELAIVNAKQAGQDALFEKLAAGLNAYKMETQLVAMGLTRFISEADIVRFYKQCSKGLRLDYVRNFTRVIPDAVTAKKVRADELGVFDNYVVLHYDPQTRSYAETEAEKAQRRDPILFGLMKDRQFLYVVGDWIDEVCDLTLDQLADKLGRNAVKSLVEPEGR